VLGPKVETLMKDLLSERGARVHSVTHRVKQRESLERKLARAEKEYARISDITDVLGLRVITYFPDEVDQVARIIESEFEIDAENSIDRRNTLAPDTMGYLSLHYVAKIDPGRSEWTEYRRFADTFFEVQVRSILQHAWAEIEHDLGYKTEEAIPREVRRRFSRLAGLLEIADEEFRSIRDDLAAYVQRVQDEVVSSPTTTLIDRDSLAAFISGSSLVRQLDEVIASHAGQEPAEPAQGITEYAARLVQGLARFGITTIAELEHEIRERQALITRFSEPFRSHRPDHGERPIPRGVSVFYMLYLLGAERGEAELRSYCQTRSFLDPDEVADDALAAYRAAIEPDD
jgi:ppGpp synthetase/RelA/SpoT-type nucleotidyltranferase